MKDSILYIDDEPDNLIVFRANFVNDFKVYVARNTDEAMKVLQTKPIKLMLVDYKMPEEDGISFVERINHEYPQYVKILVTAYTESEIAINAINTNAFYAYVTKPWGYIDLKSKIYNGIEKYKLEQEKIELISKLQESYKREKEANRVKNVFLQNISHEIRTPLNGIFGFTELILSNDKDIYPQLKRRLSIIEKSGKRLLKTVDDIVESSLIITNQIQLKIKEFNLFTMVDEILSEKVLDYEEDISINDISNNINKDFNAKNDGEKIKKAISNIIDNAFKFSPKQKHISIYVKFENGFYKFSITNNSEVLLSQEDKSIYQPFLQNDDSMTRAKQGSGLGLFVAKSIAEFLGGKLWHEISEDGLITFNFTIKAHYTEKVNIST